MTDDTLSPFAFRNTVLKARGGASMRFALARVHTERDSSMDADTLRFVLGKGLEALGWPPDRCELEYARHKLNCLEQGTVNEFEKGRS